MRATAYPCACARACVCVCARARARVFRLPPAHTHAYECAPMRQHCPIVHPYHVICCWQHVTRNTICKIVWKLSDSAWGHQCETKRSKQNMTMCSVHAVRRMCFANGEEHASTLAMARQQARDRKIQMPNGRQRAPDAPTLPQTNEYATERSDKMRRTENHPRVIHLPVQ